MAVTSNWMDEWLGCLKIAEPKGYTEWGHGAEGNFSIFPYLASHLEACAEQPLVLSGGSLQQRESSKWESHQLHPRMFRSQRHWRWKTHAIVTAFLSLDEHTCIVAEGHAAVHMSRSTPSLVAVTFEWFLKLQQSRWNHKQNVFTSVFV